MLIPPKNHSPQGIEEPNPIARDLGRLLDLLRGKQIF